MSRNRPAPDPNDCPQCGCNDTIPVRTGRFSDQSSSLECDYCGHVFVASATSSTRPMQFLEKRIPICPTHRTMRDNGRSAAGKIVYYSCGVPNCPATGKGGRRIV